MLNTYAQTFLSSFKVCRHTQLCPTPWMQLKTHIEQISSSLMTLKSKWLQRRKPNPQRHSTVLNFLESPPPEFLSMGSEGIWKQKCAPYIDKERVPRKYLCFWTEEQKSRLLQVTEHGGEAMRFSLLSSSLFLSQTPDNLIAVAAARQVSECLGEDKSFSLTRRSMVLRV